MGKRERLKQKKNGSILDLDARREKRTRKMGYWDSGVDIDGPEEGAGGPQKKADRGRSGLDHGLV